MLKDILILTFRNMKERKLRSFLTLLGIFVGIAAVVALVSIGGGMQYTINYELEKLGKNRILVMPGNAKFGPMGSAISTSKFYEKDFETVCGVRGVKACVGILSDTAKVSFRNENEYLPVWGFTLNKKSMEVIKATKFLEIENGRELRQSEKRKAVIGYNVANERFESKIRPGDKIKIDDVEFEVVGVQKKAGTGIHDEFIRISYEDAKEIFGREEYSVIFVLSYESFDVDSVVKAIEKALRKERNVKEGEEDFSVQTSRQTIERLNKMLSMINIVLIAIAAISLLVASVGIANTMYTAVLERTREIGVMKAVGASRGKIALLFLIESGMLGLIGGLLGVSIGIAISLAAERIIVASGITIFKAYLNPLFLFGMLAFSFIFGMLSGLVPALQASKLNPIEALRRLE